MYADSTINQNNSTCVDSPQMHHLLFSHLAELAPSFLNFFSDFHTVFEEIGVSCQYLLVVAKVKKKILGTVQISHTLYVKAHVYYTYTIFFA